MEYKRSGVFFSHGQNIFFVNFNIYELFLKGSSFIYPTNPSIAKTEIETQFSTLNKSKHVNDGIKAKDYKSDPRAWASSAAMEDKSKNHWNKRNPRKNGIKLICVRVNVKYFNFIV